MHTTKTMRWLVALVAVSAGLAHAEDPEQRKAREELERQLQDMVGTNPARIRVDLVALDEPNFKLEEAAFELDGKGLLTPLPGALEPEGTHQVYFADVKPGRHTLGVKLVYASTVSPVVSDEGGYKWNLGGTLAWDFQAGIEVHVTLSAVRDARAKTIKDRIKLKSAAAPVMFARLDDGKMPEPPPKPKLEVDAGVLVAEKTPQELAAEEKKRKAEEAAEAKKAADEEKKRKAEEAAEARKAAAEEKQQKAAEAAEARKAAAEEKKRKAQEATEAKKAAAEEKKRQAEEAAAEKKRLAEEAAHPKAAEPADAGAAVAVAAAEPVDAGPAEPVKPVAEVKPQPPDAGPAAVASAPAEGGPPWIFIGAGALAVIAILLFVLARRRSNPRI